MVYSEDFKRRFPKRLAKALEYREVRGKELAQWLGGMAAGTVSAWKTGRAKPPHAERRRRIEELLMLPKDWLDGLGGEEDIKRVSLKTLSSLPGDEIELVRRVVVSGKYRTSPGDVVSKEGANKIALVPVDIEADLFSQLKDEMIRLQGRMEVQIERLSIQIEQVQTSCDEIATRLPVDAADLGDAANDVDEADG